MIIDVIELNNYRNYSNISLSLNKNINILYGKNAQGKTNLLESIYLCSTTKSHRTSKDSELIKIGEENAHIRTIVFSDGDKKIIDIHLKNGKSKGIAVNNVPIKKSSEAFGILKTVLFSPEDLDIVKRGPENRRKFLDMELCQIDKLYLRDLSTYKKALNQRNRLLKDTYHNSSLRDMIFAWDEKILLHGQRIIEKRRSFIEELCPIIKDKYNRLTSGKENLDIFYEPNVSEKEFAGKLLQEQEKDIRFGQTSVGPHRDDIGFKIKDLDIRKYGSQGQQRSCALSLKLSEIDIIKDKTGHDPILLLDDVLSELDSGRQGQLIEILDRVQTIITCTGMKEILENKFNDSKVFIVEDAEIKEMED